MDTCAHIRWTASVLLVVFLCAGCGSGEARKLARGVTYAEAKLNRVDKDPFAAAALGAAIEGSGNIVSYLKMGIVEPEAFPRFEEGSPSGPWTVVVKAGKNSGEFTILGFGEDLETPLHTRNVVLKRAISSGSSLAPTNRTEVRVIRPRE